MPDSRNSCVALSNLGVQGHKELVEKEVIYLGYLVPLGMKEV